MYTVTLGEFQESKAKKVRFHAIENGYAGKNSIITKGKNYLRPLKIVWPN